MNCLLLNNFQDVQGVFCAFAVFFSLQKKKNEITMKQERSCKSKAFASLENHIWRRYFKHYRLLDMNSIEINSVDFFYGTLSCTLVSYRHRGRGLKKIYGKFIVCYDIDV